MLAKQLSPHVARQRLELLCSRSEHCSFECREKLRKWGINTSDADAIIDALIDGRYIDDRRFASAFARDKLLYNHWGKMKITLGLRAKRIPSSLINEALDSLDEDEYQRVAREFLSSRAKTIKEGFTYEGRTKLYRAGLSRGFESSLVASIVKSPGIWPSQSTC